MCLYSVTHRSDWIWAASNETEAHAGVPARQPGASTGLDAEEKGKKAQQACREAPQRRTWLSGVCTEQVVPPAMPRGEGWGLEPGRRSKLSSLLPKGCPAAPFKQHIKEASALPHLPLARSEACVRMLFHLTRPGKTAAHFLESLTSTPPPLSWGCPVLCSLCDGVEQLMGNQDDPGDPWKIRTKGFSWTCEHSQSSPVAQRMGEQSASCLCSVLPLLQVAGRLPHKYAPVKGFRLS